MLPPILQQPETATSDERARFIMGVRKAIREGEKATAEYQRCVIDCLRHERAELAGPKGKKQPTNHNVVAMADDDI